MNGMFGMGMKRYLFIIAIFASSCSSSSTSPGSAPSYGSGEFGFTVNGQTVDRIGDDKGTAASATIASNSWLTISLTYPGELRGYAMNGVNISLKMWQLRTGTLEVKGKYNPVTPQDSNCAIPSLQYVGVDESVVSTYPQGSVTITKIDTLNNLVSGRFQFIIDDAPLPYDTVTNGFFNDVPIITGGGGFAGSLSGIRNDDNNGVYRDDSFHSPKNGIASITCYKDAGTKNLEIQANVYYPDASSTYFNITLYNAQDGYFPFTGYSGGAFGLFSDSNGADGGFFSGGITITKFDTVNHRFSGSFSINASGGAGGVTFNSTFQGTIDSVRWYDL